MPGAAVPLTSSLRKGPLAGVTRRYAVMTTTVDLLTLLLQPASCAGCSGRLLAHLKSNNEGCHLYIRLQGCPRRYVSHCSALACYVSESGLGIANPHATTQGQVQEP